MFKEVTWKINNNKQGIATNKFKWINKWWWWWTKSVNDDNESKLANDDDESKLLNDDESKSENDDKSKLVNDDDESKLVNNETLDLINSWRNRKKKEKRRIEIKIQTFCSSWKSK